MLEEVASSDATRREDNGHLRMPGSSKLAEEVASSDATQMVMMNRPQENLIYYVTTVTQNRLPLFVEASFIILLYDSLHYYRHKLTFKLLGYVFMPDHIHLLLWPLGEATISDIMRDYKKFTATRIVRQAEVENRVDWLNAFAEAGQTTGRAENKVWQDSFWDKIIYTERFLRQKLNYIHRNPIRAGLVTDVEKYPYSSYRNYVLGDDSLIKMNTDWL